jgi:hypothetical protein
MKYQVGLEEEMTMIASFPNIFKDMDSLSTKAIIRSLARYAVAHDKVLEAADVSFRVDGRGNVLMVEPERQATHHQKASSRQEKCIIVPRQEAYERIMYATRKKMEQMRSLYEGVQRRSRGWEKISYSCCCLQYTTRTKFLVFAATIHKHKQPDYYGIPVVAGA